MVSCGRVLLGRGGGAFTVTLPMCNVLLIAFIFLCSLESTEISKEARANLEEIRVSLERPADKELEINYLDYGLVFKLKRAQSNM